MKKIFFILVLATFLISCGGGEQQESVVQPGVLQTSPNWDYLPFESLYGTLNDGENSLFVSQTIAQWELAHSDREIVDLDIIYQPFTSINQAQILGVSIYSKSKEN